MALGSTLLGDAYVNIMGETSKLERSLAQAQGLVSSFVSNAGKAIAVGMGAALAGIAGTGMASVWAWAKEEQSVKDLESSIRMLGGSVEELVPKYEKAIAQIQQNTRIGDDASRSAMAYAASMGAPVDRLDELAIAAAGLAERLGMNMRTAMMYLTRGLKSGQFSLLTRYGLVIDQTKSKAEQFNQVLEFGITGFGKAADMADTLTGRLTQLKNNFGDLMESLGKTIAERFQLKEIVDEISKRMYRIVQMFDTVLKQIKPGAFSLERIGQAFENIVIKIIAIISSLPAITKELNKVWKGADFMSAIGTVFWEAGKLLVKSVLTGLSTLRDLFVALGRIIGNAVKTSLLDVPIIGKKIASPYLEKLAAKEADYMRLMMPGAKINEKNLLTQMKGRFEADPSAFSEQIFGQLQAAAAEDLEAGVDFALDAMKSSTKLFAEHWKSFETAVEAGLKKSGIDPEATKKTIREIYDAKLEEWRKSFAAASMTEGMPGIRGKGDWEIGGAGMSGEPFQKTGFAAWWDKMQEATKMTEAEKEQIKAQQAIEKNTRQLVAYFKPISSHNGSNFTLWSNFLY